MQGSTAPPTFWVMLPAVSVWRCNIEHLIMKRGFSAPALAGHAMAQERTVLSWDFDAANGGPFHIPDQLSRACGPACAQDGRQYHGAVQQAQMNIMANTYASTLSRFQSSVDRGQRTR
jgi:hypothetical protein